MDDTTPGGSRGRVRVRAGYDAPFREPAPFPGPVAFYDETVDVYVDGELQARPRAHLS